MMFTQSTNHEKVIKTQVLSADPDKEKLGLPYVSWANFAFLLSFVTHCEEVDGDEVDLEEGSYTQLVFRDKSVHIVNIPFHDFLRIWAAQ
jgi:hypothetical protein